MAAVAQSVFAMTNPEVWIITATDGDRQGGLVATWVRPASIDPDCPSLMIAIDQTHYTADLISASGAFAAHLIRPDQLELVWRFAIGSGRDHDKLSGLEWVGSQTGSPVLADCLAWLDCQVYESKLAGDRIYFWGDVVAARQISEESPLSEQDVFRLANPKQLSQLKAAKSADIEALRPLRQIYRDGLK